MTTLEDIQTNAVMRGILPDCAVTVLNVQWFGSEALELTYRTGPVREGRKVANTLLYRHDEPRLELAEAQASLVDPLPHQITAVYEEMLSFANRCGSCSPTIPGPARPSWRGSSSRS